MTWDSASGWHRGINSWVRLAAMIPAMRAVARTSPFLASPLSISASVAGSMITRPPATATRSVISLSETSTMRAAPLSSIWVSFAMGRQAECACETGGGRNRARVAAATS